MSNAIQSFFDALTDDQLQRLVAEQRDIDLAGVLPSAETDVVTRQLVEAFGIFNHHALTIVRTQSLRCAAFRWLAQRTC